MHGSDDRGRVALELDRDVEVGEGGGQQRAGAGVELALHQAVEQVDDGHRAALRGDAARRLEAEQAAADDGGVLRAADRRRADRLAVLGSAERVHARQVDAGDRRHQRLRAGREDELVVGEVLAVVEVDDTRLGVDRRHPAAEHELDVVVGVPLRRTQLQRLGILAGNEDLRQAHAVVRRARLAADERDRDVAIAVTECFTDSLAGDAPADDHDRVAHAASLEDRDFPSVLWVFPGDERVSRSVCAARSDHQRQSSSCWSRSARLVAQSVALCGRRVWATLARSAGARAGQPATARFRAGATAKSRAWHLGPYIRDQGAMFVAPTMRSRALMCDPGR